MAWSEENSNNTNYTYIVRCSDGSYYTGWTNDIDRRIKQHNEGSRGAKYTRSRRPVTLVYYEIFATPGEAMSREWHLKKLSHKEKERLVETFQHSMKENAENHYKS